MRFIPTIRCRALSRALPLWGASSQAF